MNKPKRIRPLTERQKRWAMYFAETGNGTEAARRAGYHNKLTQMGCLNQRNPQVMAEVEKYLGAHKKEVIADTEEILTYLTSVMRGVESDEIIMLAGKGSTEVIKARQQVQAKDRLKAAELLGKRHGLFNEKLDLSGNMALSVVIDYGNDNTSGEQDI